MKEGIEGHLTPEEAAAENERTHRSIMDLVANISMKRAQLGAEQRLPEVVHAVVQDPITDRRFGAFVKLQYNEGGTIGLERGGINRLNDGKPVTIIADIMLERYPGTPLLCDQKIAAELAQDSLQWMADDHYQLLGRDAGVLEVFTPYRAQPMPTDDGNPPGLSSQLYTE